MRCWWQKFAHPLHSRVGLHTRGPREEEKDHLLQIDAANHKERTECGTLDIWDSRAVLLHVQAVIYTCKQMELDVNFSRAQEAVTTEELNLDVAKEAYVQVRTSEKKVKGK